MQVARASMNGNFSFLVETCKFMVGQAETEYHHQVMLKVLGSLVNNSTRYHCNII
jgi:hypothetical protein